LQILIILQDIDLNIFTHQFHTTQDHIIAIKVQIPTNISKNMIIVIHSYKKYNMKFWLAKVLEKCVNNQYWYIIFFYFMYYIIF
jgi:hypothetical protein